MPFEVRDRVVTAVDAENFTNYFSNELAGKQIIRLSSRAAIDDAIKREFAQQQSDWSDANKTAEVGRVLNADWIVIGVVSRAGNRIMLNISLFELNTREQLPGVTRLAGSVDNAYDAMTSIVNELAARISGTPAGRPASAGGAAAKEYKVGDRGPAGGWIFYDKRKVTDGWQYLEAAPRETEFYAPWGAFKKSVPGTRTGVGTGKQNTEAIVKFLQNIGESDKAAQLCDSLEVEDFDDWFLPSKDELNLMYTNLKAKGLGEFRKLLLYWSSSESDSRKAWVITLSIALRAVSSVLGKNKAAYVRPVRAF
jgi:TolB-like protein